MIVTGSAFFCFSDTTTSPWPRAFYVDRVTAYDSLQQLVEHIRTAGAEPFVVVERRDIDADPRLQALTRPGSVESSTVVRARDYVLTNNSTSLTIDVPAPGVVYLGEAGAVGDFVATLNGERVSQLTANYAFKALVAPQAGTYRVAFRYWPRHFTAYLASAVVGLVLWTTILAVAWKYLRASRAAEPSMKRADQTPCTA